MANVNSITNNTSSTASLYGSRNVLSGLASGMDTEAMIENSVSGYQTKIDQLQQDQTKIQWKQDSLREIIDLAANLNTKYTSYTSSSSLMSATFYNSASSSTVGGAYASAVTASGSSSSTVEIARVEQLATNAYYTFSPGSAWGTAANNATESINVNSKPQVNKNAGVVQLSYGIGDAKGTIQFEIGDFEKSDNGAELADLVRSKLRGLTVTNAKGERVQATDYYQISTDSSGKMTISGKDYKKSGDDWVEQTATVTATLNKSAANANSTFNYNGGTAASSQTTAQYLQGKSITVTYNGLDKRITFPVEPQPPFDTLEKMRKYLEDQINEAFGGSEENPLIEVTSSNPSTTASNGKLSFNFNNPTGNESLKITSDFNGVLGLDDKGLDTKVDASKTTLESVLGRDWNQPLTINGVTISTGFTKDSTIDDVMSAINGSSGKTGVTVSYSNINSQFVFSSTGTGSVQEIRLGGLAQALFGEDKGIANYQEGKDAIVSVKVNGGEAQRLMRSSNTIDLDGLKVTLKSETPEGVNAGITFGTSANSDRIVDAVKSFVEDFNKLSTTLRNAYATQPSRKSDGSSYEPLTDKDRDTMSESAIKNYEETAKQGLLFGDNDLSSMYSSLIRQIAPSGTEQKDLADIGITTSYKDGITTLTLDESKLRSALDGGTDKVKKVLADSSYGAGDGLMGRMKKTLDTYTSTSVGTPGILVRKAGTKLSAVSLLTNAYQKQIDRVQEQIERWQTKLSSKVDYYTRQFTKLEQLMNTMNSQSSMMSGLMGGG